jgi:hypothetical protein
MASKYLVSFVTIEKVPRAFDVELDRTETIGRVKVIVGDLQNISKHVRLTQRLSAPIDPTIPFSGVRAHGIVLSNDRTLEDYGSPATIEIMPLNPAVPNV